MEISKLLEELKIADVEATDENGNTALHLIINSESFTQKEMIESIELMLDSGVNPDAKNKRKETVLQLAVANRMRDVVDYLISRKISTDSVVHFFIKDEYVKFQTLSEIEDTTDDWDSEIQKIERDGTSFAEWLVSKGFDFDCENEDRKSALYMAIKYNLQHILLVLLKCTKNINAIDEKNRTLLHLFFENNSSYRITGISKYWYPKRYAADIVDILLDRGVCADAEDFEKRTALELATERYEDISIIEMLLERYTNIHRKGIGGRTLLQTVIKSSYLLHEWGTEGYLQILHSILAKGADVKELDEPNEYGHTPLCYAVKGQNIRVIDFLEENGADFRVITKDGENLLHFLAKSDCAKTDADLKIKLFDKLMGKGCQVNAKNKVGNTPLHYAACNNNTTIARKLIEHGAEVNCKRNDGMTPIHMALLASPSLQVVQLLREKGADFNVTTQSSATPMHQLVKSSKYMKIGDEEKIMQIFQFLIREGCQINAKDRTDRSPIHLAVMFTNAKVVQMLIDCGADVNCRNDQMETPLHLALSSNEAVEIMELLLKHGANVDAKDSQGHTPLHKIAKESRSSKLDEALLTLLEYGADVNAQDMEGLTVLSCARARDSRDFDQECREYVQRHNEYLYDVYCSQQADLPRYLRDDYGADEITVDDCELEDFASDVVKILTKHSVRLKAARLPWDRRINGWLGEFTRNGEIVYEQKEQYEECLDEIEKMKSTFIDYRTTLNNLLRMDSNRRCAYINNEKLLELMHSRKFTKQFPQYYVLILARYNEAVTRRLLVEQAKESWLELTEIDLPDICIERIFSFLSNLDLFRVNGKR